MRSLPIALVAVALLAACGGGDDGSPLASGGNTGSAGGTGGGGVVAPPGPVSPLDAAVAGALAQTPDQPASKPVLASETDLLNPAAGTPAVGADPADALPLNRAQLPPVTADPDKPNS